MQYREDLLLITTREHTSYTYTRCAENQNNEGKCVLLW